MIKKELDTTKIKIKDKLENKKEFCVLDLELYLQKKRADKNVNTVIDWLKIWAEVDCFLQMNSSQEPPEKQVVNTISVTPI